MGKINTPDRALKIQTGEIVYGIKLNSAGRYEASDGNVYYEDELEFPKMTKPIPILIYEVDDLSEYDLVRVKSRINDDYKTALNEDGNMDVFFGHLIYVKPSNIDVGIFKQEGIGWMWDERDLEFIFDKQSNKKAYMKIKVKDKPEEDFKSQLDIYGEMLSLRGKEIRVVEYKNGAYVDLDGYIWNGEDLEIENDPINPDHYKQYKGFEVIQITEQMNFCLGNAVKYILRAGKKEDNSKEQDLRKAIWYLERELSNEKIRTDK